MSHKNIAVDQPEWVCMQCGSKYGRRLPKLATWHTDICPICKRRTAVTEPRDFGYLKEGWTTATK